MDAAITIQLSRPYFYRFASPQRWLTSISLLLFLLFTPHVLHAQEIVIRGRAIDPQGKALPGVSIQIISQDQKVAEAISVSDGQFVARLKSSGQFTLKA